ncbi:MAG TPA: hypothetical protein PLK12_04385 [Prolixibacteraceae bacterium]|nr:hypothetical protein [Prolixibacteraceae bacterium]
MSVSFIYHKGKKILYSDFSECKTQQDTLEVLEKTRDVYRSTNENFLALNNFTNAPVNNEFMDQAKKYAKECFDMRNIKEACFGLTPIKMILLSAYNLVVKQKIMAFKTKEEALDFLAS